MARQVLHVERLVQILVLLVLVGRLIESAGHAMDRTHSTGRHTRPGQDARRTLPGAGRPGSLSQNAGGPRYGFKDDK